MSTLPGKLGTMHLVRDENGRPLTAVVYLDPELASMPTDLRNEYLDAVETDETLDEHRGALMAMFAEPLARWEP
jgi:hypothetical protein